jgi:predicted dehydrogenase
MGGTHAQCYAALPNAQLVAVADPDPDRRKQFADTYAVTPCANVEELVKANLDMVDICMPTYLHEQAVTTAAAARKHILCEKPMALTGADCEAMIRAVQKAGVTFMVGHVIRFWPEYTVIKEILDSGRFGRIRWASATRLSAPPTWSWQEWIFEPALSGGAALDLHIHDLDFLAWILGTPKAVFAAGVAGKKGGVDNIWTTMTGCRNGVGFAEGSLDMAAAFPFTMGLKVVLEGASIEFNSRLSPSVLIAKPDGSVEHPEIPQPQVRAVAGAGTAGNIAALGGYFIEVQYFVNCLERGEAPTVVTAQEAKQAVELCVAATRSAQSGQPVRL